MKIGMDKDQNESELGTITYPTSQYTDEPRWSLSKSGNIVTGTFMGNLASEIAGQTAIIATLPEGFRPKGRNVHIPGFTKYGSAESMYWFRVNTNGNITSETGKQKMSARVMIQFAFAI